MTPLQNRARMIVERLKQEYPDAVCSLDYIDPLQLLISVRLAAQCTDARVNMVTPTLFQRFPDAQAFADADVTEVEEIIKSCGLYKTKARDLVALGKMLVEQYDGKVPDNMDDLLKLPGIGRKTANLVLGDVFGQPAVVCDTHCIRLTNLMGLTVGKDPYKVEMQLRDILPMEEANDFCHRLVHHGRAVCVARRPQCDQCCVKDLCDYACQNNA
ncbi:endonuclease III [Clostridiaceae bacterium NSJ-31]|uniref:Endonuclease III n=1 Tax=Ligaoa zhengdingensis TaxID=2763658 RepID=A0A926DX51_9FIRM|nr:endonuclease III [Ligaoa zhengdingensis]MBC8545503.1 endonuclease III [Ligaoa zhengdingensis]